MSRPYGSMRTSFPKTQKYTQEFNQRVSIPAAVAGQDTELPVGCVWYTQGVADILNNPNFMLDAGFWKKFYVTGVKIEVYQFGHKMLNPAPQYTAATNLNMSFMPKEQCFTYAEWYDFPPVTGQFNAGTEASNPIVYPNPATSYATVLGQPRVRPCKRYDLVGGSTKSVGQRYAKFRPARDAGLAFNRITSQGADKMWKPSIQFLQNDGMVGWWSEIHPYPNVSVVSDTLMCFKVRCTHYVRFRERATLRPPWAPPWSVPPQGVGSVLVNGTSTPASVDSAARFGCLHSSRLTTIGSTDPAVTGYYPFSANVYPGTSGQTVLTWQPIVGMSSSDFVTAASTSAINPNQFQLPGQAIETLPSTPAEITSTAQNQGAPTQASGFAVVTAGTYLLPD